MRGLLVAALLGAALPTLARAESASDRGEYIVRRVGMCGDCHTPRDAKGALIPERWLGGAALDLKPIHPMPFAVYAPKLAGLPQGYTVEQLAVFLQTGQRPNGSSPLPPMPAYRLSAEDAQAVAIYLQSLH